MIYIPHDWETSLGANREMELGGSGEGKRVDEVSTSYPSKGPNMRVSTKELLTVPSGLSYY